MAVAKTTGAPLVMSREAYDAMHKAQDGRCLLCGKRQIKQRLTRDHDHLTGRIRGLLCMRCNRSFGAFEWSDDLLIRLRRYIMAILADHLLYHAGLPPYQRSSED